MNRQRFKTSNEGTGLIPVKLCLSSFLLSLLPFLFFSGCTPVSYPKENVEQAIREIAQEEYKLRDVKIEFAGTTLGVYLPIDQLFAADFKEAIMSGKVTNMENLFQPTDAAIDKVENMLLSMSRVMLSTDRKIECYYLQTTDIEKTGMELIFIGNIEDVKRVRFWDIPRSEYRKRVIHDIRLNRAALWHRPVRHFFRDLNTTNRKDIQTRYFPKTAEAKWAQEFFFRDTHGKATQTSRADWNILDLKSIPIQDNEIVVYAKVEAFSKNKKAPGFKPKILEYLFQISIKGDDEKVRRIIPMAYLDDKKMMPDFTFTREMVYQSLPNWEREFKTPDITVGDFLSMQLSRRLQTISATDERLYNTFTNIKLVFRYDPKPETHFLFHTLTPLRGTKQAAYSEGKGIDADILYLWDLAAREFVEVVHSYGFQDYQYLQFQMSQDEEPLRWNVSKDDLELFRNHKKDLKSILKVA